MKYMNRFLTVLGVVALMSCGNSKEEEKEETFTISDRDRQETVETSTDGDTMSTKAIDNQETEDGVVQIYLTANDQMQFNKDELRAEAGQTVRLTLEHVGQLPETAMGHNFVLLKKETDITDFAQRAAQARSNDYIPKGSDEVIANSDMVGGGESTTVEFEVPEQAGTYTFICSFPGHYIQMQGRFIVE